MACLGLLPREQARAAKTHALRAFALDDLCGRRVDRLSMGQRQRLRLALGLLHNPDVALLDEPLSSLDDEGAGRVSAELERLRARGGSAIVCAPTGDDRSLRADIRYIVEHGRLVPA